MLDICKESFRSKVVCAVLWGIGSDGRVFSNVGAVVRPVVSIVGTVICNVGDVQQCGGLSSVV